MKQPVAQNEGVERLCNLPLSPEAIKNVVQKKITKNAISKAYRLKTWA